MTSKFSKAAVIVAYIRGTGGRIRPSPDGEHLLVKPPPGIVMTGDGRKYLREMFLPYRADILEVLALQATLAEAEAIAAEAWQRTQGAAT